MRDMNSPRRLSDSAAPSPPPFWLDAHAAECGPAYPALFATFFAKSSDSIALRVRTRSSRAALVEAVRSGEASLAVMPGSLALRSIAHGLAAKIVCAAVSPVDLAAIDGEPTVPWDRVALAVRHLAPRAVLVASNTAIETQERSIAAAIASYWSAAAEAAAAPALLGIVLTAEFGMQVQEADRIARQTIAAWRLDPAVRLIGLHRVADSLAARGDISRAFDPESALDQRFVVAERASIVPVRATVLRASALST
jgi:hypothetical protein